jgi:hypothetical protein
MQNPFTGTDPDADYSNDKEIPIRIGVMENYHHLIPGRVDHIIFGKGREVGDNWNDVITVATHNDPLGDPSLTVFEWSLFWDPLQALYHIDGREGYGKFQPMDRRTYWQQRPTELRWNLALQPPHHKRNKGLSPVPWISKKTQARLYVLFVGVEYALDATNGQWRFWPVPGFKEEVEKQANQRLDEILS